MSWVWRMLGLISTELVGKERNWGWAVLSSQGDIQFGTLHSDWTQYRLGPERQSSSQVKWSAWMDAGCFTRQVAGKLINFHPLSIDNVIHKPLIHRWEPQSPSKTGRASESQPIKSVFRKQLSTFLSQSFWSKATDPDSSSLETKNTLTNTGGSQVCGKMENIQPQSREEFGQFWEFTWQEIKGKISLPKCQSSLCLLFLCSQPRFSFQGERERLMIWLGPLTFTLADDGQSALNN